MGSNRPLNSRGSLRNLSGKCIIIPLCFNNFRSNSKTVGIEVEIQDSICGIIVLRRKPEHLLQEVAPWSCPASIPRPSPLSKTTNSLTTLSLLMVLALANSILILSTTGSNKVSTNPRVLFLISTISIFLEMRSLLLHLLDGSNEEWLQMPKPIKKENMSQIKC
ncbi:hypothetical protein H5410_046596 [Solanum commersonii]|uniref:Uncharacterized protein n=1 Tax=Solanum commersonii TaxID=4109 RepID=A0A9J5XEQ7_SOLCO|nr:hypothetical protein H5410_046596 [Solanum commersonii]